MYLEHFGLRESPFRITPHTEFFFSGANRGATLEALIYAITHDEGIVKVSGEVGSGKTMLCRMLLERLPEDVDTVYLANPSLSREEILYAIADDLKLSMPEGRMHAIVRTLQEHLVDIYAAGRKVVIMIDEAHAMPPETLEEIRLLSNLETNRHKLVHIVLFGQPELDDRLAETGMRQLKERITHNFALESLQRDGAAGWASAKRANGNMPNQSLCVSQQIQVIGAGPVPFKHGELWIVARRDPFVTEVTVDLKHAIETADHQTLQIQLRRDTQVHVDVERIMMGDERTRGRTARNHLHHRRFHFHKVAVNHELTNAGHDL